MELMTQPDYDYCYTQLAVRLDAYAVLCHVQTMRARVKQAEEDRQYAIWAEDMVKGD